MLPKTSRLLGVRPSRIILDDPDVEFISQENPVPATKIAPAPAAVVTAATPYTPPDTGEADSLFGLVPVQTRQSDIWEAAYVLLEGREVLAVPDCILAPSREEAEQLIARMHPADPNFSRIQSSGASVFSEIFPSLVRPPKTELYTNSWDQKLTRILEQGDTGLRYARYGILKEPVCTCQDPVTIKELLKKHGRLLFDFAPDDWQDDAEFFRHKSPGPRGTVVLGHNAKWASRRRKIQERTAARHISEGVIVVPGWSPTCPFPSQDYCISWPKCDPYTTPYTSASLSVRRDGRMVPYFNDRAGQFVDVFIPQVHCYRNQYVYRRPRENRDYIEFNPKLHQPCPPPAPYIFLCRHYPEAVYEVLCQYRLWWPFFVHLCLRHRLREFLVCFSKVCRALQVRELPPVGVYPGSEKFQTVRDRFPPPRAREPAGESTDE